jgi:hypothetical protein
MHTKLWASKVVGVPILRISRLQLGSPKIKWNLGDGPMARHKEYYKGGGGGFPSSLGRGESYESMFAHGSSVHQKCFSYALTNLLFSLCKSMWIIDSLVIHPSPHSGTPGCPSSPEVLRTKECAPIPCPFIAFTLGFVVETIQKFGGASFCNTILTTSFAAQLQHHF